MNITDCRFCQIKNGNILAPYDQPIKRSDGYFSLTSVGAFIRGWSLIIPEAHTYSMRDEYAKSCFLAFANDWINHVKKTYKKRIIVFEHGANHCASLTSCGTNHAHLHVVPYDNSLLAKMKNDRSWISVRYDHLNKTLGDDEYLLYAEVDNYLEKSIFYVHFLAAEESQYFRKLLGEKARIKDYNYKTTPYYNDTIESYLKLSGESYGE